jgi:hypothetical protein
MAKPHAADSSRSKTLTNDNRLRRQGKGRRYVPELGVPWRRSSNEPYEGDGEIAAIFIAP